ncbi:unnamed protein product, partial [Amoebophrya sp. A120]
GLTAAPVVGQHDKSLAIGPSSSTCAVAAKTTQTKPSSSYRPPPGLPPPEGIMTLVQEPEATGEVVSLMNRPEYRRADAEELPAEEAVTGTAPPRPPVDACSEAPRRDQEKRTRTENQRHAAEQDFAFAPRSPELRHEHDAAWSHHGGPLGFDAAYSPPAYPPQYHPHLQEHPVYDYNSYVHFMHAMHQHQHLHNGGQLLPHPDHNGNTAAAALHHHHYPAFPYPTGAFPPYPPISHTTPDAGAAGEDPFYAAIAAGGQEQHLFYNAFSTTMMSGGAHPVGVAAVQQGKNNCQGGKDFSSRRNKNGDRDDNRNSGSSSKKRQRNSK